MYFVKFIEVMGKICSLLIMTPSTFPVHAKVTSIKPSRPIFSNPWFLLFRVLFYFHVPDMTMVMDVGLVFKWIYSCRAWHQRAVAGISYPNPQEQDLIIGVNFASARSGLDNLIVTTLVIPCIIEWNANSIWKSMFLHKISRRFLVFEIPM